MLRLVFLVLSMGIAGCVTGMQRDAEKWVKYVCAKEDPAVIYALIRQTERSDNQTFRCPAKGKPVTLASTEWRVVEGPADLIGSVNDVQREKADAICRMPPGPDRDEYLRQLHKAGVAVVCPDIKAAKAPIVMKAGRGP